MLIGNSEDTIYKVLVVDDNISILRAVETALRRDAFVVHTAVSGEEALSVIARTGLPHLAIVDLNMPGMDGFELCEAIHEFSDLPIVMLTAIDDEETVVFGLDRYAEDYIVKPFRPAELIARVRRVLRRMGDYSYTLEPVIKVDENLQVDFPNRKAFVADRPVRATPTETKLLYILYAQRGPHRHQRLFAAPRLALWTMPLRIACTPTSTACAAKLKPPQGTPTTSFLFRLGHRLQLSRPTRSVAPPPDFTPKQANCLGVLACDFGSATICQVDYPLICSVGWLRNS